MDGNPHDSGLCPPPTAVVAQGLRCTEPALGTGMNLGRGQGAERRKCWPQAQTRARSVLERRMLKAAEEGRSRGRGEEKAELISDTPRASPPSHPISALAPNIQAPELALGPSTLGWRPTRPRAQPTSIHHGDARDSIGEPTWARADAAESGVSALNCTPHGNPADSPSSFCT